MFKFSDLSNIHRIIRNNCYRRKLKSCGKDVTFCRGVKISHAKNVTIGNNVRFGVDNIFSGLGDIIIGNNVCFGPQVMVWSSNHNYYSPKALPFDETQELKPVIIEDNVWVSARVCITPGVTIGEGAVIAMGAVVINDVPKGAVVGGNPAKVLKYRDMEKYYQLKAEKKFQYLGRK